MKKLRMLCMLLCILMLFSSCMPEQPNDVTESTGAGESSTEGIIPPITSVVTTGEPVTTAEPTAAETEAPPVSYGVFTYTPEAFAVDITSPYAIMIDAVTNEILYLKGSPNARIYPASTTKLLTALVALKYCEPDVVFTPGEELTLLAPDASTAYIKTHHKLSLEMLIEGMMLPSGGDAAYVIAANIGRIISGSVYTSDLDSVPFFIDEMNRYGKEELGLIGSNFTCPDGDHNDNHYTTLADIMTVARAAMDNSIITKYAAIYKDDVRYASGHKNTWMNSNQLINPDSEFFYENATGLKTGTTDQAGCCLVATAALGTRKVLVGVFGAAQSDTRFSDARALLVAGMDRD